MPACRVSSQRPAFWRIMSALPDSPRRDQNPRRPDRRPAAANAMHQVRLPGCRPYAEAIAAGERRHQPVPAGRHAKASRRLAAVTGRTVIPINPVNGLERPRPVAFIDESLCIGCTLCIQACPVDAILGAAKQMHTILPSLCTGCDLCVAPCPVDCIVMCPVTRRRAPAGMPGARQQADDARARHDFRTQRLRREARGERRAPGRQGRRQDAGSDAGSDQSRPKNWQKKSASAPSSPPPWSARAPRRPPAQKPPPPTPKKTHECRQTPGNLYALSRRQSDPRTPNSNTRRRSNC